MAKWLKISNNGNGISGNNAYGSVSHVISNEMA